MKNQNGSGIRKEYQIIWRLAWPAIVQELLATVVTYADTAMVGALGAEASAAVGLTGTVNWLFMTVAGAFGIGVLSVCAQADGAGDEALLQKSGQQAAFFTLIMGGALTAAAMLIAPYVAGWLNGAEEIRADATAYFTIVSMPMLFRTASFIFSSALRGVSEMKKPMEIGLMMNALNIVLNFLLIYPERTVGGVTVPGAGLGVRGAAIATAVSCALDGILMTVCWYRNPRLGIRKSRVRFDRPVFGRCLRVGIPVALQRAVVFSGHIVYASMVAALGVVPFAAHAIALKAEEAFYIPGFGLQAAAETLAGNAMGERDEKRLNRITLLVSSLASGVMLLAGALLVIFSREVMAFFTPDAEVIEAGAGVLRIVALSEPIYGIMIILEGVFNGIGDTKVPMFFAFFTMWAVRVAGTFLAVRVFGFGLRMAWVMMIADNIIRCVLLFARYRSGGWKKTGGILRDG